MYLSIKLHDATSQQRHNNHRENPKSYVNWLAEGRDK
jgi:hypothetical protein